MTSAHEEVKPIGVVILNWNGVKLLRQFLPSVLENTPTELADIVVADNGSTDDSLFILEKEFPEVKVVAWEENLGFAGGYNKAIQELNYKYILLLNSDIEVTPLWLEPLYNLISKDEQCAAVQPKIRYYRERHKLEYAGAAGGYLDALGYPYCRGRIFDTTEEDKKQYDYQAEVFWTTGAAMLVRRDLFLKLGGFDARFFAHQEEIDLCWRLKACGYKLYCEPLSVVFHLGGASLSAENPRKTFLNFKNNLLMLEKNLPLSKQFKVLFPRLFLDFLAALVFLLTAKPRDAWAVLRAWNAFSKEKGLPTNEWECEEPTEEQKEEAYKLLEPTCLLWRYHIKRQKTYNELIP